MTATDRIRQGELRLEHRYRQGACRPPVMEGSEHFITTMDCHIMQRQFQELGIMSSMGLFEKTFNAV